MTTWIGHKPIRNYENEILGTSDTWSTSHLSQQTSEPTYYIVDCRIFVCTYSSSRLQAACSRCGTSTAPSVLEAPTRIGHRRARAADTSLQTNHARASPRGAPLTTVSWLWHGARAADTSLQPNHAPHRAVGRRRLQPLAGCAAARRRRACWTPTMLPRELEF